MTEIFKFENQQVRFVGTADNPWWVAKDICDVLEISKHRDALARLDEDERELFKVDTLGGKQEMSCVNESGLYSLILTSRKPQAKKFKKWVTSEVLPAIRKTGKYSLTNPTSTTELTLEDTITLANFASTTAQNAGVSKAIAETIKLDSIMQIAPQAKPLLQPQKQAITSAHPLTETAVTPTIIGQRLATKLGHPKISSRAINKKLLALGYQTSVTRIKKTTGKEVHDYYRPTEKTLNGNHGQLEMTSYQDGTGKNTKYQLRWFNTIVEILANNWEAK